MIFHSRHILPSCVFILVLFLTFFVYLPGLSGPFLFDDYVILPSLEQYGKLDNWSSLKLYLFSGNSGPLGRPLSLLSFLIDGTTFSHPERFKFTNLIIHLLNGCLLFILVLKLENIRTYGNNPVRIMWVALLLSSFWLLHPFNISTTLYVVQRMAMLSGFFILLGLILYTVGRSKVTSSPRLAYVLMSLSVSLGTIFAVLSKENGCLLPVFILVFEAIIFKQTLPPLNRIWKRVFLILPSLLLLAYFTNYIFFGKFSAFYEMRTYTAVERLMTEARILFDYLANWFFPYDLPRGLHADDYHVSKGLFSPLSTLISILGISVLCFVSISSKFSSALRLAVSFFLVGHLIESTVLPLELYFEHRNYIPVIFLFYPLILFLEKNIDKTHLKVCLSVVVLIVLSFVTFERSSLWANEFHLAKASVDHYPESIRARRHLAQYYDDNGRLDLAYQELLNAEIHSPNDLSSKMTLFVYSCRMGEDLTVRFQEMDTLLEKSGYQQIENNLLQAVLMVILEGKCKNLDRSHAHQILDALSNNKDFKKESGLKWMLSHLKGHVYAIENNGELALKEFANAQSIHPNIEAGMQQVALLATYKNFKEALILLDKVEKIISKEVESSNYWGATLDFKNEIIRLRDVIEEDLKSEMEN
jgi:protein O-mannosyl-transferase